MIFTMTSIENLEALLSSEDINGSIIELDNFIGELCSYGDDIEKLTEPQKQFYYNQCLEREINNGGFYQYFINSSGNFAYETVLSLRAIGADTTAEILQKAIAQFPDHTVPTDRDERISLIEQIEETANEAWVKLEDEFFEYQNDLNALNINFVREHLTEF